MMKWISVKSLCLKCSSKTAPSVSLYPQLNKSNRIRGSTSEILVCESSTGITYIHQNSSHQIHIRKKIPVIKDHLSWIFHSQFAFLFVIGESRGKWRPAQALHTAASQSERRPQNPFFQQGCRQGRHRFSTEGAFSFCFLQRGAEKRVRWLDSTTVLGEADYWRNSNFLKAAVEVLANE